MAFCNPSVFEVDTTSPYYRPEISDETFEPIYQMLKQHAVGMMTKLDPTHASVYQTLLTDKVTDMDPVSRKMTRLFFAGCSNPQDPLFQFAMRNQVAKLCTYMRFQYERKILASELQATKLKNPVFIFSLPRSGTTFLYTMLSSHPNACNISMYEHFMPGPRTMTKQARIAFSQAVLDSFKKPMGDFDTMHRVMADEPEEEVTFCEMFGHATFPSYCIPRVEQIRHAMTTENFDVLYEGLVDDMKMHMIEFPMRDDQFLVMKGTNHLQSLLSFLNIMERCCENPHFIWLHRNIADEIKSCIPLVYGVQMRYTGDLGIGDVDWFNKNTPKYTEVILKNAIAQREAWLAQDLKHKDMLLDVSFDKLTNNPLETIKEIFSFCGIEFTDAVKQRLEEKLEDKRTQKKAKYQDKFATVKVDQDQLNKQFAFYHEYFKEYIPQ